MSRSLLTSLFIAAIFMVAAVGVMMAPSSMHAQYTQAILVLVVALAISGWQLATSAVAARPAIPSMMAHLFFVFFLIIPALYQLATAQFPWDMSTYKEGTATKAAGLVLLFLVCFVAGGGLASKKLSRAMRAIIECERRRRGAFVIAFVVFASLIAVAAILGFGLDTLVTNRSEVSTHMAEEETKVTAGLYLDLPRAITFCAVLAVLYLFGRKAGRAGGDRRTMAVLLAVAITPLFAVVNYPQALPRYWLFGMVITVLLLYVDMRKVRNRMVLIAGMGGGAYTIFPYVRDLTTAKTRLDLRPIGEELVTGNFDGFEMVMNIAIAAERFGHTLGHQFLSALLFFVPRSLWEGKAVPSGYYTAEKLGHHFTNLSAPTMGELYLDFSYVGVVVGGLAIGYVYRRADTLYAASLAFGGITLHRIQAAMLAGFTIILMRGALLAVIALIATSFTAIFALMMAPRVAAFFSGRRARPAALRGRERAHDADALAPAAATPQGE